MLGAGPGSAHLAFNDMHEARHQLWTLQEEVKVVEDDLWIPEGRTKTQRDVPPESPEEKTPPPQVTDVPGHKTLEHLVVPADELDEARRRHPDGVKSERRGVIVTWLMTQAHRHQRQTSNGHVSLTLTRCLISLKPACSVPCLQMCAQLHHRFGRFLFM